MLLVFFVFLFDPDKPKSDENLDLPLPNAKEYVAEVNKWIDKKNKEKEEYERNMTPELEEKQKAHWKRMLNLQKSRIREIRFYGKVVDQYGNPVDGAYIAYSGNSAYLASGTGVGYTKTDEKGMFFTDSTKGDSLSIKEIVKEGYEIKMPGSMNFYAYKRFPDSMLWTNFNEENPYIFKAWKVGEYAKINTNIGSFRDGYSFKPDGRIYTLNFLRSKTKIKTSGRGIGDISVSFTRTDTDWSVHLAGVDGGLQEIEENSSLYLNVAPENGYQESFEYRFGKKERDELVKKYFFKSRNGQVYGRVEFRIYPMYRSKEWDDSYCLCCESGKRTEFGG